MSGIGRLLHIAVDAAELAWMDDGVCAETDPEAFFPEKGGSVAAARRVCARCPVRTECLEYALGHNLQHGIWGGMPEGERRRSRKGAAA